MPEMINNKDKKRRRGRKSGEKSGADGDSVANYQAHKTPFIQLDQEAPTWFEYGKNLPGRNDTTTSDPPAFSDQNIASFVTKYRSIGDLIYQKEIQLTGNHGNKNSDQRWVENTMKKGTLKDRIAAMSVTVSSEPVHKFYALDGLLSMVGCSESGGKTNSRVAQLTSEALEDLFISAFLPPNRKLLSLAQRPLYRYEADKNGQKPKHALSPRILLLWRFEEMVKDKYELYLRKYMAHTLQDAAEIHKIATLNSTAALLSAVPEGEAQLLGMMVNKLGDPGKKVAAAAGHQLRTVLLSHPNMQIIIAREVQQLAHRPHLSPKALYNCIVFLNQLKLEREERKGKNTDTTERIETLPASLIKTYFRLFEVAVQKGKVKKRESEEAGMKSRLLCALLTGVNRAHPYLPEKDQDMEEHIDALYRVVHTAESAACTQSLMLLFHLSVGSKLEDHQDPEEPKSETQTARQDRFYRALYATLSKPELIAHGKHLTMYFNLLYKAMKYDTDINRINAFAKRLMCTVLHSNAAPVAACLFLLNEIAKTHDGLRQCMAEIPDESDAHVMLDDTKREPRAALVNKTEEEEEDSRKKIRHPPCWELSLVSHHFHPSVAKFANAMGNIEYAGDPLKDFQLAPFLDKFAYRNPKSRDKLAGHYKRGESIAERRSGTDGVIKSRLEVPVNDPAFLERETFGEQDEFFRTYFVERARRDEIKGITRSHKNNEMDEDQRNDAEEGALDIAEETDGMDTRKSFEEYERSWESDAEEEAFVDSLAEQLMEDTADGAVDFDDEDPDDDDWGDLHSDDDKKKDENVEVADFEDAEMDDEVPDMEESGDESDEAGPAMDDEDAFMDAGDDSEDNDGADDEEDDENEILASIPGGADDDDDDDDDDDLAFVNDEESDDEEETPRSRKKAKIQSTFADAEEYEEQISESFNELVTAAPADEEEETTPSKSKGKSPKKNRKKKGNK